MSVEVTILLILLAGAGTYLLYRREQEVKRLKHKNRMLKLEEETTKLRKAAGKSDKEFMEAYNEFKKELQEAGIDPDIGTQLFLSNQGSSKSSSNRDS